MQPRTDAGKAVADHRCWTADLPVTDLTVAEWEASIRAIEAQAEQHVLAIIRDSFPACDADAIESRLREGGR